MIFECNFRRAVHRTQHLSQVLTVYVEADSKEQAEALCYKRVEDKAVDSCEWEDECTGDDYPHDNISDTECEECVEVDSSPEPVLWKASQAADLVGGD